MDPRPDEVIVNEVKRLVAIERKTLKDILDLLQIINDRKIYAYQYSSLVKWMIHELGYSEAQAYRRKSALRLTQELPETKQMIASGELNLSTIGQLQKDLKEVTPEKKRALIHQVRGKTSEQTDKIIRAATGRENEKKFVRYELKYETLNKIDKAKAFSKQYDLDKLLDEAMNLVIAKYTREIKPRKQTSTRPRTIAPSVRAALLHKANYQCQYPGCKTHHSLELDHQVPVALGGTNTPDNLRVLCRPHNQLLAKEKLGLLI